MKKLLLLAILGVCSFTASAQQPEVSEPTVEFNKHWFMQLQAGAAYTIGESTTIKDLISFGAAASVGYQFTPLFGLRGNISGWEAKGSWPATRNLYSFNYAQLTADAMFNLNEMFGAKKLDQIVTTYLIAGAGANYAFNNEEANSIMNNNEYHVMSNIWEGSLLSPVVKVGLAADFRLSKYLGINLEVNSNFISDKFNSKENGFCDVQLNALAGLTIRFGAKTKEIAAAPVEPVYEELVDQEKIDREAEEYAAQQAEAAKAAEEAEAARLAAQAAEAAKVAPLQKDVVFQINSFSIENIEEGKINELIAYMQANPESKINITGYADNETGSKEFNLKLSEKRAKAVATAITEAGIDANRINVEYKGSSVQPYSTPEKNRVAICIAE